MRNPNVANTYRASLIRVENNCAVGDVVNKLGRYEDIGTPEEFEKLKNEQKKRTHQPK